ncbi:hypothetical protein B7494_g5451 [Chlorociboria aeruginascens]|nr:hypothetical protein B7494_g5451 [Chlorociboria aeruginascens]
MGEPRKGVQENEGASEHTPLLPAAERDTPRKGPVRWAIHNALIALMTVLVTLVIVFLCVFFGVKGFSNPSTKATVCLTPACVHASSEILYNLSPEYKTIDPCTNFEELVCGGWSDRHDLRPDQGDAFTGTIMDENSQMLLRHILEAPYPEESKHSSFSPAQLVSSLSSVDQQNFEKLQDAYNACMDEDTIKHVGIKPLLEVLHQVVAMFPVQESAFSKRAPLELEGNEQIAETVVYLTKLGVTSLVSCGAGADDKDPDSVVVQASPPRRVGLPAKDYYKDDSVVGKYENALAQVLEMMHPDYGHENATLHAGLLIEFEKKMAAAAPDAEDQNDVTKTYNPMSLKDVDLLIPQLHLSRVINNLAPADYKTTRLIVASPQYLKALSGILSSTSKEVLQTYFIWKVIQAYASVVEADQIKPYTQFINELQGKDPNSAPERWRTCVNHVDEGLGWILSRFFVEKAFSAKAKDFGDQIVSDIKDMFIAKLQVTKWMDESVIKLAIEKSPNIMDPPTLLDYYQSVNITPTTFFQNALAMNRLDIAREWSSLGKPVDHDTWGMSVPTVNAYYNPPGNEIVFPAGIMQFPVFDVNVPQYLSYGAFGSVSGHELSHAFDSTGRHYNENGAYSDWWTNSTVVGFEGRADCFVDQYHNYTVPGPDGKPLNVNGRLTLGENIADAGGVSAAFKAWKKHQAETPNEDLPGLEYFTQEQLFFVSYGNWWCGKSRKETAISRIYTDPHAPKWARILGTMANSRDFKESFKCASKEPVCELW